MAELCFHAIAAYALSKRRASELVPGTTSVLASKPQSFGSVMRPATDSSISPAFFGSLLSIQNSFGAGVALNPGTARGWVETTGMVNLTGYPARATGIEQYSVLL